MSRFNVSILMPLFQRSIALLFLLMFVQTVTAQEPVEVKRSSNKVVIEGNVYYVHVVKPGQTIYSISRAYNVSEKELRIENPGITNTLSISQVLKIPVNPDPAYRVDTTEDLQPKRFHEIREGETIYSISRLYQCSVEEILQANPNLDINDIPVGLKIALPPEKEESNTYTFNEEGMLLHTVKRGESLYSIARYYEVSVREIKSVNKSIGWGRVNEGDVIRIPKPQTFQDQLFTDVTPIKKDSLSPPSDTVQVDLDSIMESPYYDYSDWSDQSPRRGGRGINVAYLIPFNYQQMEPLDSLLKGVESPRRRQRIAQDYKLERATPKSTQFLEFLEGSLLAIDSLTRAGVRINVNVYDTKRSMYTTREILSRPELSDMDLIIGPFFAYNLEIANVFSLQHNIPLITPFHSNDSLVLKNPYLIQSNPSRLTEFKHNAKFISRLYDQNLIYVHAGDSAQLGMYQYYKELLFDELEQYSAMESVLFKEVVLSDANTDALLLALKPDTPNLVILPTMDEAFASRVASVLYYALQDHEIEIFGSAYWAGFDDIEIPYIHDLNLKISHTHWYDMKDSSYVAFLDRFRQAYMEEPYAATRKGCRYSVVGYDLSLFFISAFDDYGRRMMRKLSQIQVEGTLCDYDYQRLSRSSGYENMSMRYYSFDKGLEVHEIGLPDRPEIHHYLQPAGDDPLYYWNRPQGPGNGVESDSTLQQQDTIPTGSAIY